MPGTSLVGARAELLDAIAQLRVLVATDHPGLEWAIADYGGLRSEEETKLILKYRDADWAAAIDADPSLASSTTKEAWRPIAPFGSSLHNYGAAFDVVITATPVGMTSAQALSIVKGYAASVHLIDGRTFTDPDPPHFELPGGLAAARALFPSGPVPPPPGARNAPVATLGSPQFNDTDRVYGGAATPKTPVLLYQFVTPDFADTGNDGGIRHGEFFVPGEHPTLLNVSLVSFELTDAWGEFENCEMTFEDPEFELANCPALIEGRTVLSVSFGYSDMLSPARKLRYYRNEMDFSESGRVTTKLSFLSLGIELGLVRQAKTVTAQMVGKPAGTEITLADVAQVIAKDYGLTAVIDPDMGLYSAPSFEIPGQTALAWLNDKLWNTGPKNAPNSGYLAQVRNGELRITSQQYDKDIEHLFVYRGKDSPLRTFRPSFSADLQRGGIVLGDMAGINRVTGEYMSLNHGKGGDASGASGTKKTNIEGKTLELGLTNDDVRVVTTKSPDAAVVEGRAQRVKVRSDIEQQIQAKRIEITTIDQMLVDKVTGERTTDRVAGIAPAAEWRRREKERLTKEMERLILQKNGIDAAEAISAGGQTTATDAAARAALRTAFKYHAQNITPALDTYFKNASRDMGVETALLKAIASHESEFVTGAYGRKRDPVTGIYQRGADYGIMQINTGTAPNANHSIYKYDIENPKFNVAGRADKWYEDRGLLGPLDWPNLSRNDEMNIFLGASVFRDKYTAMKLKFKDRYGNLSITEETLLRYALSAYNAGTRAGGAPKFLPDGVTLINKLYVDDIMARYAYFRDQNNPTNTNPFESDPTIETSFAIRDNIMESMIQKTMTASIELWGYPLINTGQPIGIVAVPSRYNGKWFVFKTTHKLDRATGFTTSCELHRYMPGTDEKNTNSGPVPGGARAEPQKEINLNTGEETKVVSTPASGVAVTDVFKGAISSSRNINTVTVLPSGSKSNP
jgi:soluble lytic murein transglycosylase-like protein